ncbi:MAG: SDR family oxidoreductase [Microbacterium sp.]|uniref:SDR family NAD(P)-dependent oxidoreductase n=1 Tax=Microbacterium sp. TaxID=51671 RepID=UPI001AD3866C|nr:SDR family oxidoreductase [Microbacterium sp.]MBN9155800.1 SDR family oxidoreductase [Microbacterium sp.]
MTETDTERACVVTGGAGSIGGAIGRRLRADGWRVVSLDLGVPARDAADVAVLGDVAAPAAHAEAAERAVELGALRGWVNCAGYNILGSVAEVEEAAVRRGIDVDLLGVFFGAAEAARRMGALDGPQRGSIVNISSIHAAVGFPGFAAYAMAKGGIEALTRQVAAEYVASGIRCNAVAPGLIESEMNAQLLAEASDPDALQAAWAALTPMGRWGTPDDVAAVVAFLLDGASGYITGEVLAVNGGATVLARGR